MLWISSWIKTRVWYVCNEKVLNRLPILLKSINLKQHLLGKWERIISIFLQISYFIAQGFSLALTLQLLLFQLIQVLILVVDFVDLSISKANCFNLFRNHLFDRISFDTKLNNCFIQLKCVSDGLTSFILDIIVSQIQHFQSCERTLYHLWELSDHVATIELTLGKVEFLQTKSFLVGEKASRDFDYWWSQFVAHQVQTLQVSITSQPFTNQLSCLLIQPAVTHV